MLVEIKINIEGSPGEDGISAIRKLNLGKLSKDMQVMPSILDLKPTELMVESLDLNVDMDNESVNMNVNFSTEVEKLNRKAMYSEVFNVLLNHDLLNGDINKSEIVIEQTYC